MSPIEEEKLKFLKEKNPDDFKDEGEAKELRINLLGIEIHCHFQNLSQADYLYLENYYQPFLQKNQFIEKTFKVFYTVFKDSRSTLNHPWYGERYPQIQFLFGDKGDATDDEKAYIIERDYCAQGTIDHLYVYGPAPSADNPDSLDNLFAMLFASCNDQHQAMLLHSAAVVEKNHDNKEVAYIFFGKSGAGKSTLAFHASQAFDQKVISSDQTLLRLEKGKLLAQSTSITIPELKRDSPLRTWESYEVAGLIHLTQEGEYGFRQIEERELLKLFIGQSSFYLTPFSNQQAYLDLCTKIIGLNLVKGELTYEKGGNFWGYLEKTDI